MSLESWKAEFYDVPASDVNPADAAEHSLKKWLGLRPDALGRHGCEAEAAKDFEVFQVREMSADGWALPMNADTCALCERFFDESAEYSRGACAKCPLAIVRRGTPCTTEYGPEAESPYAAACKGYPELMIKELQRAVAYVQNQSGD